jgi:hypothetical protein
MFGIFYGHLDYFTAIWYTLWSFGNVVTIWYIFHHFEILRQEKSGNPVPDVLQALGLGRGSRK